MTEKEFRRIMLSCELDKKPKKKTLDKVLIWLAIFLFLFIVSMIVIFCIFQSIPDTLVTCVLSGGAIEVIVTAWITTTKEKQRGRDNDE